MATLYISRPNTVSDDYFHDALNFIINSEGCRKHVSACRWHIKGNVYDESKVNESNGCIVVLDDSYIGKGVLGEIKKFSAFNCPISIVYQRKSDGEFQMYHFCAFHLIDEDNWKRSAEVVFGVNITEEMDARFFSILEDYHPPANLTRTMPIDDNGLSISISEIEDLFGEDEPLVALATELKTNLLLASAGLK